MNMTFEEEINKVFDESEQLSGVCEDAEHEVCFTVEQWQRHRQHTKDVLISVIGETEDPDAYHYILKEMLKRLDLK